MPVISFIVSTHRPADFAHFKANLQATVESSYEIISIENPGRYSLAEAYNIGARRATGAFLCFVHEDVSFCDSHWDVAVLERFEMRPDLGLLGVLGSMVRPDLPIGFFSGLPKWDRGTFRELDESNSMVELGRHHPVEECAVRTLDGLFLFARREVWERFPFDENIPGFHFYDVDFSFRIAQHYRVEVAPKLMIEHDIIEPRHPKKGHRRGFNASWVRAVLAYKPRREGLLFDELDPADLLKVKQFWLSYICMPGCPFVLRWQYWRRLRLSLFQAYGGLPIFFPGLFQFIKSKRHARRRIQQQRHYESTHV